MVRRLPDEDEDQYRLPFTLWELGKGLLLFGGFLAVLIQIGRWWGTMDAQLQEIGRIASRIEDVIIPKIEDHERRLLERERRTMDNEQRIERLERARERDVQESHR